MEIHGITLNVVQITLFKIDLIVWKLVTTDYDGNENIGLK